MHELRGLPATRIIHKRGTRRAGDTAKKMELVELWETFRQRGKPCKLRLEWSISKRFLQCAIRKAEKWMKIVLRRTPVPDSAFHFTWVIPVCPHKQPQEARAEVFWERGLVLVGVNVCPSEGGVTTQGGGWVGRKDLKPPRLSSCSCRTDLRPVEWGKKKLGPHKPIQTVPRPCKQSFSGFPLIEGRDGIWKYLRLFRGLSFYAKNIVRVNYFSGTYYFFLALNESNAI